MGSSNIKNSYILDHQDINMIKHFSSTKQLEKCYNSIQQIGFGSEGKVYQASNINNPSYYVAIKQISKNQKGVTEQELLNEINMLKKLDHPNIIKFFEVFNDDKIFHITQEYCSGGDLNKLIKNNNLCEKEICKIMKKILEGLNYIHSNGMIHRDIKPQNILLSNKSQQYEIKIIDFGLAKNIKDLKLSEPCTGTPCYVAPEVLKHKLYTRGCDIWACGVMLYYIITGNFPFYDNNQQILFHNIKHRKFTKKLNHPDFNHISEDIKDLIEKMLTDDLSSRLTAEECLKHSWFKKQAEIVSQQLNQFSNAIQNLKNYKKGCSIQNELINQFIVKSFSDEEIYPQKLLFKSIDKENKGSISKKQLKSYFKHILQEEEYKNVSKQIFNNVSQNQKYIKYSEFLVATIDKEFICSEQNIETLYNCLNNNGKQTLDIIDFKRAYQRKSIKIKTIQIKDLLKKYDDNGTIKYSKFKRIMQNKRLNSLIIQN